MNIHHIEENINKLSENINEETFIYDFLRSYGSPKASITRLQKGDLNISKEEGEVLWKKKIFFKADKQSNLLTLIDGLKRENRILKHKPIFIIVTDFNTVLALDLKVGDTLEIPIKKITKHFQFFLPLIGMEKTKIQTENIADVKAAEKLGKLYDVLVKQNNPQTDEDEHALNVFLSRLLFCFFAEDTHIFPEGLFTNSITSHTQPNGSDLSSYLGELFTVLNSEDRQNSAGFLAKFPYVNGGLFEKELPMPMFNAQSYKIIVECGALDWAYINPDIFGSMIQSVANPEIRSDMGMHYTSVVNIMKVIEPLFLNGLKSELEAAGANKKKLRQLLDRLYRLKIFDPACGSGNFLIISYKELCAVEIAIYQKLNDGQMTCLGCGIKTNQFYGIEINDFACETAKLSLWLAEHQMNLQFEEIFGVMKPTLPLEDGGNITCGNAINIDWNECCPCNEGDKIYVVGNPPYCGSNNQSESQKEDMKKVLNGLSKTKSLDYVACWFLLAAKYISGNIKCSFVSTNSLFQGTQVPVLWPLIFNQEIELFFAHKDFLWKNNAKNSAGVTCSIVGLQKKDASKKLLFDQGTKKTVDGINPYLVEGRTIFVDKRSSPMSGLPKMQIGNEPYDRGRLTFETREKEEFISKYPTSEKYFKKLVGASELIKGTYRWCLWIENDEVEDVMKISGIAQRIKEIEKARLSGGMNARSCAHRPHQFRWVNRAKETQIVIPRVSSQRREYLPISFVDRDTIITNASQVIYDPEVYVFGILASKIHMAWMELLTGRMKTDYRYTAGLVWNCFPLHKLSSGQIEKIEELSFGILEAREQFSEKNLSDLYDPDKMPKGLREAHQQLDLVVDGCYRKLPFKTDKERLEHLFKLYEKMIKAEQTKDK